MSISLEKSGRDNFQFVPLEEESASPSVCLERDSDEELKTKARPAINSSSTYTVEDAVEAAGLGCFQLRLFLICGVLTAADAMEMLLLSILGPALRCAWHLTSSEVAAMTTVVFVGYLLGSPFWGFVSDRFGRWPIFFTVLSMISYYGFLTALSPTYVWVIILRLMVGFAIGGGSSSFTLLSEYLPVKHRAKVLICFQVFWAIGSTFEVGLAYLILPRFGWRWLVFASAIPLVLFLFLLKFLPESPRYLVTANRLSEAEHIVQNMFRVNGVRPPEGRLTTPTVTSKRSSRLLELFSKQYRLTTVLLPTIWFGAAFAYYGVVLLSAEIFRFRQDCYRTSSLYPVSSDKNLTAASIQASVVAPGCPAPGCFVLSGANRQRLCHHDCLISWRVCQYSHYRHPY
ncbi:Synaptic vesicle 2 protein [Fasciola gigantica]|uniref:Synaptic vesicle 2 protein n=1 Tax=Fasciola gigantica TaxID=46835 RepID=A0A504Y9W8_FASGI|nr:Synaptic vesicle 2 protein [Fasciola gigantica]